VSTVDEDGAVMSAAVSSVKTVQFDVKYDLDSGSYATAGAVLTALKDAFESAVSTSTLTDAIESLCACNATVDSVTAVSARDYPTLSPSFAPTYEATTENPSAAATVSPAPSVTPAPSHIPTPSPTGLCRNLCKYSSSGLYEQVHAIMKQLEYDTNRTTAEFDIEIKILWLEQNLHLSKTADAQFAALSAQHATTEATYEALLASIGLSPAREDEMNQVEAMEMAAETARAKVQAQEPEDLAATTLQQQEAGSTPHATTRSTAATAFAAKSSAGGSAAGAPSARMAYASLAVSGTCLFVLGMLLEKGRNFLASRPI